MSIELNSVHFCKQGIKKKQYKYIVAVSFGIDTVYIVKFEFSTGIVFCSRSSISEFLQDVNTRSIYDKDTFFIIHKSYYKIVYNGEFTVRQPIIDLCKEVFAEGRKKAIEILIGDTIKVSRYNYSIVEDCPEKETEFNQLRSEYKTIISKSLSLFSFEFNKNLVAKNLYS